MPAFLNAHYKGRARSVQLDGHSFMEGFSMSHKDAETPSSRATRSNSVLDQENQPPSVRHYRSMLVVDAPSLGPHKPISYDELYVQLPLAGTFLRTRSCNLLSNMPIHLCVNTCADF